MVLSLRCAALLAALLLPGLAVAQAGAEEPVDLTTPVLAVTEPPADPVEMAPAGPEDAAPPPAEAAAPVEATVEAPGEEGTAPLAAVIGDDPVANTQAEPVVEVAAIVPRDRPAPPPDPDRMIRPVERPGWVPEAAAALEAARSVSVRPPPRTLALTDKAERIRAEEAATRRAAQARATRATSIIRANAGTGTIALDQLELIGVFGTEANRRALLRAPSGDFVRVARGSQYDGWQVIAIGPDFLRMLRDGEVTELELPR